MEMAVKARRSIKGPAAQMLASSINSAMVANGALSGTSGFGMTLPGRSTDRPAKRRLEPRWWISLDLDLQEQEEEEAALRATEAAGGQVGGSSSSSALVNLPAEASPESEGDSWKEALEQLKYSEVRHFKLSGSDFARVARICAAAGRWHEAVEVLERAKSHNKKVDQATMEGILVACAKADRWEVALDLLRQLRGRHQTPSAFAYNSVIGACQRNLADWDKFWRFDGSRPCWECVLTLHKEMTDLKLEPSVESFDAAIGICLALEREDEVERLTRDMNLLHFRHLVATCARHGRWEKAMALLEAMREHGDGPADQEAHIYAIQACGKAGRWKRAVAILNSLREQGTIPSGEVYDVVIQICRKAKREEVAAELEAAKNLGHFHFEASNFFARYPMTPMGGKPATGGHRVGVALDSPGTSPPGNRHLPDQGQELLAEPSSPPASGDESEPHDREVSAILTKPGTSTSMVLEEEDESQLLDPEGRKAVESFLHKSAATPSTKMSPADFQVLLRFSKLDLDEQQKRRLAEAVEMVECDEDGPLEVSELPLFFKKGVEAVLERRHHAREQDEKRRKVLRRIGMGMAIKKVHDRTFEDLDTRTKPAKEIALTSITDVWTRVIDTFRSWDVDGGGSISKAEFRRAMGILGCHHVNPDDVDDLFNMFDEDGSGDISYAELTKALRAKFRRRPASQNSPSKAGLGAHSARRLPRRPASQAAGRPKSRLLGVTPPPPRPHSTTSPRRNRWPGDPAPSHSQQLGVAEEPAFSQSISMSNPSTGPRCGSSSSSSSTSRHWRGPWHSSTQGSYYSSPMSPNSEFGNQVVDDKETFQRIGREKLEPLLSELKGLQESIRPFVPKRDALASERAAFLKMDFVQGVKAAVLQKANAANAHQSPGSSEGEGEINSNSNGLPPPGSDAAAGAAGDHTGTGDPHHPQPPAPNAARLAQVAAVLGAKSRMSRSANANANTNNANTTTAGAEAGSKGRKSSDASSSNHNKASSRPGAKRGRARFCSFDEAPPPSQQPQQTPRQLQRLVSKRMGLKSDSPIVICNLDPEELNLLKALEALEAKEEAAMRRRDKLASLPTGARFE